MMITKTLLLWIYANRLGHERLCVHLFGAAKATLADEANRTATSPEVGDHNRRIIACVPYCCRLLEKRQREIVRLMFLEASRGIFRGCLFVASFENTFSPISLSDIPYDDYRSIRRISLRIDRIWANAMAARHSTCNIVLAQIRYIIIYPECFVAPVKNRCYLSDVFQSLTGSTWFLSRSITGGRSTCCNMVLHWSDTFSLPWMSYRTLKNHRCTGDVLQSSTGSVQVLSRSNVITGRNSTCRNMVLFSSDTLLLPWLLHRTWGGSHYAGPVFQSLTGIIQVLSRSTQATSLAPPLL